MEGTRRTRLRQEAESIARAPTPGPILASRSSRNRRDEQNAIALLEGARFAAEEADVFFVEVDVEELANLALIVADVARESGEARGKLVEGVGDRGRATVHFRRAAGKATECRWDFDGYRHFLFSLAS